MGPCFVVNEHKPSRIDHDAKESPESQLIGAPIQTVKAKTRKASPLMRVTPDDAPHLHVHGTDDPLVRFINLRFTMPLKKAGVESTLITIQAGGVTPRPVDADKYVHFGTTLMAVGNRCRMKRYR